MARPRTQVNEAAILHAYRNGASISALAIDHDVDRFVIRRVVREAEDAKVLVFPHSYSPAAPAGQVTSQELIQRSGISYRQLDYWTRTRRLNPTTHAEPGSGNARFYPASEIAVARLIKRFLDAGIGIGAAVQIARELTDTGSATLAGIRIDLPEEH